MKEFRPGNYIKWTYEHCIGRSRHDVTKRGRFVRLVNHRKPFYTQLAVVRLDGNKSVSVVPLSELAPDVGGAHE